MPKDFPENTRLGLVGHFRLTEQQKQIVKDAGLLIRHEGMFERSYRVAPLFNNVSMDTIIPDFIHSTPMQDGSRRMTCAEVGKLMTFLHLPLRGGIALAGQNDVAEFAREKTTTVVEGFGGNPQDVPRVFMDGVVAQIKDHERQVEAQATPDLLLAQKI